MRTQFASQDYENLTLAQRCNAIAEAREMAREDTEERRDLLIPWSPGDPRRSAYLSERRLYQDGPAHAITLDDDSVAVVGDARSLESRLIASGAIWNRVQRLWNADSTFRIAE